MSDNKIELEEKYNQLFSKINTQQKELESLKKPPFKVKESIKDYTKNSIKDIVNKTNVLNKNILGNSKNNINIPLSLRKCNSNGFLSNDIMDKDDTVSC